MVSRHGLKFLTILAYLSMAVLEPWQPEIWRGRGVWPVVPAPPSETRPAPKRASLPQASAGRNGPEAAEPERVAETAPQPAPAPGPAPDREAAAAAAARQAARQRYLDQVYLLARLIHGEARGEPFLGQVAVGAVVLNRVESPLFPNTIAGVIYQPGAFDVVADGQINLAPDEESIRAAKAAISGWDPTGGALYYYNPAKATSYWIWRRPVILAIGRHHFAH